MKIKQISKFKKKNFYKINEIKLNDIHTYEVKISQELHNGFKNFSGDKSPLHTSLKFCKKNGYKKKVGYAFLITAILSKIYGAKRKMHVRPSETCARHRSQRKRQKW